MKLQLELIAQSIKAARERKGLSQRALGAKVGLPQSHISKIEGAAVDLQTSSLIEIARALDLEVSLISRSALSTVKALEPRPPSKLQEIATEQALSSIAKQTQLLKRRMPETQVFDQLANTIEDLRGLPTGEWDSQIHRHLEVIDDALTRIRRRSRAASQRQSGLPLTILTSHLRDLRRLRNEIVHGGGAKVAAPLPAYRLDEEEEIDGN